MAGLLVTLMLQGTFATKGFWQGDRVAALAEAMYIWGELILWKVVLK